jgi:hypothetical protein
VVGALRGCGVRRLPRGTLETVFVVAGVWSVRSVFLSVPSALALREPRGTRDTTPVLCRKVRNDATGSLGAAAPPKGEGLRSRCMAGLSGTTLATMGRGCGLLVHRFELDPARSGAPGVGAVGEVTSPRRGRAAAVFGPGSRRLRADAMSARCRVAGPGARHLGSSLATAARKCLSAGAIRASSLPAPPGSDDAGGAGFSARGARLRQGAALLGMPLGQGRAARKGHPALGFDATSLRPLHRKRALGGLASGGCTVIGHR